jgi:hypothetical protein
MGRYERIQNTADSIYPCLETEHSAIGGSPKRVSLCRNRRTRLEYIFIKNGYWRAADEIRTRSERVEAACDVALGE